MSLTFSIFFNSDKGNNSRNLPKLLVHWMRNIICRVEPKWFNLARKVEKKKAGAGEIESGEFAEQIPERAD